MSRTVVMEPEHSTNQNNLVGRARSLMQHLNWLSPASSLLSKAGREFGRSIEASLTEIATENRVIRIQLRRRDAAVVMSISHYEEMVRMKDIYTALIDQVKISEIEEATDEFEALYHRIGSDQSRKAADTLFSALPGTLRKNFQPGATETK